MLRQRRLITVVVTFLIGCTFLLQMVGCSGTLSEAPKEKGRTEATTREQGRTAEATSSEETRCEGTRTLHVYYDVKAGKVRSGSEEDMKKAGRTVDWGVYTTNDLPGCPKGGPLLGTDKKDMMEGKAGDDEIRGLGAEDSIYAGEGDDVIYEGGGGGGVDGEKGDDVIFGGDGEDAVDGGKGDDVLYGGDGHDEVIGGSGKDVFHGGAGNDILYGGGGPPGGVFLAPRDHQPDKLYCGKGKDVYFVWEKIDYVDSSCEKKGKRTANA